MARLYVVNQPFPEWQRLGVRIVDAEDAHTLLNPEKDYVAQRFPKRDAIRAIEIRVDDIFVFLGRIFSIFNRAVRPRSEPFRMLLEPGMIWRALHGEIERDFHVVLPA